MSDEDIASIINAHLISMNINDMRATVVDMRSSDLLSSCNHCDVDSSICIASKIDGICNRLDADICFTGSDLLHEETEMAMKEALELAIKVKEAHE